MPPTVTLIKNIKPLVIKVTVCVPLILILARFAFAYDFQEGEKNWAQWAACAADSDCVLIQDACMGWAGVNAQFQHEGEAYQKELATAVKCSPRPFVQHDPQAVCRNNMCAVASVEQVDGHSPYTYSQDEQKQNLEQWSKCETSSDCAFIRGTCGNYLAVSKEYVPTAKPYFRYLAMVSDCSGGPSEAPASPTACVKGKCM